MHMTFQGNYFNGKSSAGYNAEITLDTYYIRIAYSNDTGLAETVQWNTDKIHRTDFAEHDRVMLKYGEFPFEYIEVPDKSFEGALKTNYPNAAFHKSAYNKVFSSGLMGLVIVTLLTIGVIALAYLVVVPAMAERVAEHLPLKYELQIGNAVYENMTENVRIDARQTELLNVFFKELNYKSDYDIDITVVDEPIVNAYALPGGHIVVYRGILNRMESYEELTALLSHEFSHVQHKHTTRSIFRSLSSYMLVSVLLGDAGGIAAVVIENANQLKQLGYSRSLEEEADREGVKLMREKHIDIAGMKRLFEKLKEEEGGGEIPQFLSTHPLTDSRIKFVEEEIKEQPATSEENVVLNSIWQRIKNDDATDY